MTQNDKAVYAWQKNRTSTTAPFDCHSYYDQLNDRRREMLDIGENGLCAAIFDTFGFFLVQTSFQRVSSTNGWR